LFSSLAFSDMSQLLSVISGAVWLLLLENLSSSNNLLKSQFR
jgi:hypothetical protein